MPLDIADNGEEKLIELLYQAAATPEIWPELLQQLHWFIFEHYHIADGQCLTDELFQSVYSHLNDTTKPPSMEHTPLNRLCRHMAQALQITKRLYLLEENQRITEEILNRIPVALLLVDELASIKMKNQQAESLLEQSGFIQQKGQKLQLADPVQHRKLLELIKEQSKPRVFQPQSRGISLQRQTPDDHQLIAIVMPLSQSAISIFEHAATAAVLISDRRHEADIELSAMADIYQLTPKEMRIVKHISQGKSPRDIAKSLHVSYNTVRSQLKSIFVKTNVSSQSELVNLVLAGTGAMLFQTAVSQKCPLADIAHANEQFLTLKDGRTLCFQEYGDPKGTPLLVCHSILGSRLEHFIHHKDWSREYGFRLIIPDRPGYGFSDPNPLLSYTQWTDDISQLLTYLKINEIAVTGYATGGIYATALAACLPQRVRHLVLICSGSSIEKEEDFKQAGPLYIMHLHLARHFPSLYRLFLAILERGLTSTPQLYCDLLARNLSDIDLKTFKKADVLEQYHMNVKEVNRQGVKSFSDELLRMFHPWEFNVKDITCPTTLWHGTENQYIPLSTVQRTGKAIKHSTLHLIQGQGHLMIYQQWPAILKQLRHDLDQADE
ncbi:alpha/beta fold hydrolase [Celerinatantimonas sp. YJH-8]|uniref:alpha/beta fold hydrolase n=1 Tax=Celerinatantimonas sp. YJH-8 TaxID=3228714 RepID=UPI0038C6F99F